MKNLSFFVSALALLSSSAYAAINCATLPTCESLGYTDTISQCPNKSIKCPFDTAKGTCLHEAAIGEIAYFPGRAPLGKGWLPCDGTSYPISQYPELYEFLKGSCTDNECKNKGNPFCVASAQKYHGTCSESIFAVPDYRGYFLRVAGMWRASDGANWNANFIGGQQANRAPSINTPQAEELPNITGTISLAGTLASDGDAKLFTLKSSWTSPNSKGLQGDKDGYWHDWGVGTKTFQFDAAKSNSIYSGKHVIPASYSVYAYIYAGRVVDK